MIHPGLLLEWLIRLINHHNLLKHLYLNSKQYHEIGSWCCFWRGLGLKKKKVEDQNEFLALEFTLKLWMTMKAYWLDNILRLQCEVSNQQLVVWTFVFLRKKHQKISICVLFFNLWCTVVSWSCRSFVSSWNNIDPALFDWFHSCVFRGSLAFQLQWNAR